MGEPDTHDCIRLYIRLAISGAAEIVGNETDFGGFAKETFKILAERCRIIAVKHDSHT